METELSFAEALRQHRRDRGLTQAELAERAHLSERAISDLERGLKSPQRATMRLLVEGLGLPPDEAHGLEAKIRPRVAPVAAPSDVPGHTLPAALTSFVGREASIAELRRRLDPCVDGAAGPRLVTLIGAGGCGKTRLAIEVARSVQAAFPEGAWFVDLSALGDERLVPLTVLTGLGARDAPGQTPLEALVRFLRGRSHLLVLDNCEHLVQTCAELVAALLEACSDLRVLATSRERLRVPGEVAWRVPSLAFPTALGSDRTLDPRELIEYEAVRLFVDRVQLVQPGFALTETNAPAVRQVCGRLDGIPLAIELAAARTAGMTVQEIAERLDDRFQLLTGGSRVALPRQRTLQATVDWSHNLLGLAERTLFRRLAVFAGGWELEAAEAVCAGEALGRAEILDLLTRLADRSLVNWYEQDHRGRYRLLETVRVYASERLDESGEAEVMRARHREWCQAFAERAAAELHGPDQASWFRRLVAEHDNIRAALHGYRSAPAGAEDELRLAATMGQFWRSQHVSEGRRRLGEALQRASGAPSRARAAALDWLATIEVVYGDPSTGDALARESLSNARAVGDLARAASALRRLAMATRDDDPAARVAFLQEGLECARAAGADAEAAMLLAFLGAVAAEAGEMDRVRDLLEEGDALGRRSGDAFGWVQPLAQLGWLAVQVGRLEDAEAHFQHSLEIAEGIGYAGAVGMSLIALGQVALRRGDLTGARALHCRGLLVLRDEGGAYLASGLRYAAAVEAAAGEADRAQRLLGASEVWHAARGGAQRVWLAVTHGPLKRGLVPIPPEPTDPALIRARAEGRGMTIDQATDSVLRSSDMATRAQPTAAAT